MSFRRSSRAAAALAGLFSSVTAAQPVPEPDAVVVTASRTEQRIRDAIPHTTVLTRKEIRDSQATDLPALLRSEAGFEAAQNGGVGTTFSPLSLRGGTSARTLVLIDGVRVEDAGFNTTALQHIMLDQVERIEIVRGNVSSLYGSNAIGGVIQVFTARGKGAPAPSAELMAGSRDTSRLRFGYGGAIGDTRFNVAASRFDTGGFSAIDPSVAPAANPDRDGYRNDSASLSLSHRLSGAHEIGFSLLGARAHLDYDQVGFLQVPTNVHRSRHELATGQVFWAAQLAQSWKARFAASDSNDRRRDTLNGNFNNRSSSRNNQFTWDNDLQITPYHRLSFGLEYLRATLDTASTFGTAPLRRREAESARLGYLGRFGRHSVQANLRRDEYSDAGSADTWLAGYGFDLTEEWRLTASRSTAFRAPTFFDLDPRLLGDPNLKPERARSNELGVQWARGRDRVRVVAFQTRFQDAIVSDAAFFRRNAGFAEVQGVESSYSGVLWGFDVRASFTVQDPVEQDTAGGPIREALRRSQKLAAISAHRTHGAWRLGGELRGAGSHRDADINAPATTVYEAGYTVLNLMARYNISKNLYLAARVENALDEDYRLVNGYNPPPSGVFFSVGWQP